MLKKINILTGLAILTLSGCTTIIQGTEDRISVQPTEGGNEVECYIPNYEKENYQLGNNELMLKRGSDDHLIKCESEQYRGATTIEPRFQMEWVAVDLLWDLCIFTLSCPIDLMTGAFYDYPNEVVVELEEKPLEERAINQSK